MTSIASFFFFCFFVRVCVVVVGWVCVCVWFMGGIETKQREKKLLYLVLSFNYDWLTSGGEKGMEELWIAWNVRGLGSSSNLAEARMSCLNLFFLPRLNWVAEANGTSNGLILAWVMTKWSNEEVGGCGRLHPSSMVLIVVNFGLFYFWKGNWLITVSILARV